MNWSCKKKCICTRLYGFTAMFGTFASAVYSPAVYEVAREFNVGTQVSLLGISLFLIGFGIGPLVWAPLSEVYGRKIAVLTPSFHRRNVRIWSRSCQGYPNSDDMSLLAGHIRQRSCDEYLRSAG
ncbi:uncharacterized protein MYCGRDRAFT_106071 [Zymoseptoria tritici IPO323]|uniref:Major facilitator superfamily (MFS) profile domain-containing protein n=1 Tax=Zymoseptoria tritici (strain CBS 115943 / IPO323) TaxID=336722 RepID=F9XMM0_ZYMTI|nr:uncharacterized protein MYCGRDRAFT_106071 [Zymoseptoria tritici IPO323]EGP83275.1 hypothetical protein MYCGRDRAFT_106071 [Zymoseptoria tritici IPO323]